MNMSVCVDQARPPTKDPAVESFEVRLPPKFASSSTCYGVLGMCAPLVQEAWGGLKCSWALPRGKRPPSSLLRTKQVDILVIERGSFTTPPLRAEKTAPKSGRSSLREQDPRTGPPPSSRVGPLQLRCGDGDLPPRARPLFGLSSVTRAGARWYGLTR